MFNPTCNHGYNKLPAVPMRCFGCGSICFCVVFCVVSDFYVSIHMHVFISGSYVATFWEIATRSTISTHAYLKVLFSRIFGVTFWF